MAGNTIKGLTVEIDGETRGLDAALKGLGRSTAAINKELGQVERALKFNPNSTVLLGQKQALLAEKVDQTRQRLEHLRAAQDKVDAMYASGEIDDGQYRAFQRDVVTTENKLEAFEGQLREVQTEQNQTGDSAERMGRDIEQGADRADRAGGRIKGMFRNIGLAASAAALAAGAALTAMIGKTLENADELQRLSDATGLTAERLGELQFVGGNVGVELDTIARAQAKMTRSMDQAREGTGEQAEAFAALGVSVIDSNGNLREAETVMSDLFAALAGVENETERDAAAMAIFGRSAQDLNPLITANADELQAMVDKARETGAIMSNEAVAGLDLFGDTLGDVKASIMGEFGEWFGEVAPDIAAFIESLHMGNLPGGGFLGVLGDQARSLGETFAALGEKLAPMFESIQTTLGPMFASIRDEFGKLATEVMPTIQAIIDFVVDNWPAIREVMEPIIRSVVQTIGGLLQSIIGIVRLVLAVIRGDWGAAGDAIKSIIDGLKNVVLGIFTRLTAGIRPIIAAVASFIGEKFNAARDAIMNPIRTAIDFVGEQIDKVKRWWDELDFELPHIDLPHFSITGSFSLNPPRVPALDIDWYAQGGSFAPGALSLVGVGDQSSGYEHILRDDQIVALMRTALGRGGAEQHLHFHAQNQSYSETRRATRDALETAAVIV